MYTANFLCFMIFIESIVIAAWCLLICLELSVNSVFWEEEEHGLIGLTSLFYGSVHEKYNGWTKTNKRFLLLFYFYRMFSKVSTDIIRYIDYEILLIIIMTPPIPLYFLRILPILLFYLRILPILLFYFKNTPYFTLLFREYSHFYSFILRTLQLFYSFIWDYSLFYFDQGLVCIKSCSESAEWRISWRRED